MPLLQQMVQTLCLMQFLSLDAIWVSAVQPLLMFCHRLYLFTRVIAVTFCVTLAASLAARLGATPMAAFQICLQVWLASSLLADGLAVAGQAILASAFAEKDYEKATAAASRVLQMGFVLGLGLSVVVGLGLQFGDRIFSNNLSVLHLISTAVPFVAGTQPINSLSFVFDGVNFGASDFAYSAYSMDGDWNGTMALP
ncbi:Protein DETOXIFICATION 43 [Bienertia sinuspersici]